MQRVLEGEDLGDGIRHRRVDRRAEPALLWRRPARFTVHLDHRQRQRSSAQLHVDPHFLPSIGATRNGALDRRESYALGEHDVLACRRWEKELVAAFGIGDDRASHPGAERRRADLSVGYRASGHIGDPTHQDVGAGIRLSKKCRRHQADCQQGEGSQSSHRPTRGFFSIIKLRTHGCNTRFLIAGCTVEYLQPPPP